MSPSEEVAARILQKLGGALWDMHSHSSLELRPQELGVGS